jgi:hypothetical protein
VTAARSVGYGSIVAVLRFGHEILDGGGQPIMPYEAPEYEKKAFDCPHCGVRTSQSWIDLRKAVGSTHKHDLGTRLDAAVCFNCGDFSVWYDGRMIYPFDSTAPLPNPDLPEEIRGDYEEARSIAAASPRGAAALLRLAIDKLCDHLGTRGENLNQKIGYLVREEQLDPKVQKSLDTVRVIGNEAVHPGQLDLRDDTEVVGKLFGLVNVIAEAMITIPRHVDEIYEETLPESKKEQIRERDEAK